MNLSKTNTFNLSSISRRAYASILLFLLFHFYINYLFSPPEFFILNDINDSTDTNNILKPHTCLQNGWPSDGTRVWWKYYYYPEYPTLQDIFEDNGILTVILSTVLIKTHQSYKKRMAKYHSSQWALYFHDYNQEQHLNVVNIKTPIITRPEFDKKIFIIKLRFEIPKEYQNKYNFATIQIVLSEKNETEVIYRPPSEFEPLLSPKYFKAKKEIQGGYLRTKVFMEKPGSKINIDDLSYRNIPFCQIKDKYSFYVNPIPEKYKNRTGMDIIYKSKNGQTKDFMRVCTQNTIFDEKEKNEMLFRWIFYNIDQGISKPIIYINKFDTSEKKAFPHLSKIIKNNIAEFIYYIFPYAFYFHEQVAQEVSCTERNRDRTVWLGHDDVDERFYYFNESLENSDDDIKLVDVLKNYTTLYNFQNYGGLKCTNLYMKKLENDTTLRDAFKTRFDRTKMIIIPENVKFLYIHTISRGKQSLDTNITNAHFKDLSKIREHFVKEFFSPRMTKINQKLTKKLNEYLV